MANACADWPAFRAISDDVRKRRCTQRRLSEPRPQ